MLNGKKILVVMPAYNAGLTLEKTFNDIPQGIVDDVLLVDDCSSDNTLEIASKLNIRVIGRKINGGYGANQKTCYNEALKTDSDIIIMLHPDYQYDPKLIPALSSMLAYDNYDCAIASRMLVQSAKSGKMPKYKYISNRFLTLFENILLNKGLSEYHSGYRAFSRNIIEKIPYNKCDDGFVFDNQMLALIYYYNFSIGEISCPTRYFDNASSINFYNSLKYGFGCLNVSVQYLLAKTNIYHNKIFK